MPLIEDKAHQAAREILIMEKFNLTAYQDLHYMELMEVARSERNVLKRKALFEYADEVLERETTKEIERQMSKGASV